MHKAIYFRVCSFVQGQFSYSLVRTETGPTESLNVTDKLNIPGELIPIYSLTKPVVLRKYSEWKWQARQFNFPFTNILMHVMNSTDVLASIKTSSRFYV